MSHSDNFAKNLLSLYRSELRAFLLDNGAGLSSVDQNAELLERALEQTGTLKIGFVGESQVGKSTLVNALLDKQALPSGGIGPLTSQATRVVHADENGLSVTYHAKKQLNQHAFAIARFLERRGDISRNGEVTVEEAESSVPEVDELSAPAQLLQLADFAEVDSDPLGRKEDLIRYMINQAKRILHFQNAVAESDPATDVTLLDGLRSALEQKFYASEEALAPYQRRISEVKALLGTSEEISQSSEGSAAAFNRALRLRAAGWMSPLVSELTLRLNSPILRSISLIDLPGIGVLNDPAGQEAECFVRTEGDALVIVFRNSGVTESVAELLERTGVITKLLFGGGGDVPPIQLVVAITHLDDVAHDRYRIMYQEAKDNEEPLPDRNAIFQQLSSEMSVAIRDMIGNALRSSKAFEDLPESHRASREKVIASLCSTMKVVCVASPDYLNLSQGIDEGMHFLSDAEATNIPDLRRHLASLGHGVATRRGQNIVQFERALNSALRDHLAAIAQMYEEGRGAAAQEFERFRIGLTAAAEPLRHQMHAYHGDSLSVLRNAMHVELQMLCKDAEIAGMKKLQRLTRDGRDKHYGSLRAALVRNGVWDRQEINYPESLTLAMVNSIASEWDTRIVSRVRTEVRTLADRDLKLVERLCETASALNARILAETSIDTQKRILQENSRTAVAWTKEQLEELRKNVSTSLREAIQKPIERACLKAIRAGAHAGTGAKNRILSAFEEGGSEAIEQARAQAEATLKKHYDSLLRRLDQEFLKDNHDPVQSALETLTGEQVTRARRSDAARKRVVKDKVREFTQRLRASDRDVSDSTLIALPTPEHVAPV
jgi:hypothetical protein